MANHLTLGIYANGQCTHNIVKEEDLENHIRYNKIFRFGRLLYVDGKRVHDGSIQAKEDLERYDRIAEEFFRNQKTTISLPTIPYA